METESKKCSNLSIPLALRRLAIPCAGHQQVEALFAQNKQFDYVPEAFAATVQRLDGRLIAQLEYGQQHVVVEVQDLGHHGKSRWRNSGEILSPTNLLIWKKQGA